MITIPPYRGGFVEKEERLWSGEYSLLGIVNVVEMHSIAVDFGKVLGKKSRILVKKSNLKLVNFVRSDDKSPAPFQLKEYKWSNKDFARW